MVDADAMVVAFLRERLGVQVGTKIPNPRPARFVRAWRSGGAARNRALDRPHITVTAWGRTEVDAADLAAAARHHLMNNHVGMPLVRGVEEAGGLYYDPDPVSGVDRYTFTVALAVRARRA